MLLSNLTFCVSKKISKDFEHWIKTEVNQSQYAEISLKTFKLLTVVDENSENFSLQIHHLNEQELNYFENEIKFLLLKNIDTVFNGEYAYFQTLLQTI